MIIIENLAGIIDPCFLDGLRDKVVIQHWLDIIYTGELWRAPRDGLEE